MLKPKEKHPLENLCQLKKPYAVSISKTTLAVGNVHSINLLLKEVYRLAKHTLAEWSAHTG